MDQNKQLMRQRFWSTFHRVKYKEFYYALYKKSRDDRICVFKIVLAATTCTGVASLSIWDYFPSVWAALLLVSQILSIVCEHLPFAKQSDGIEYILQDLRLIAVDVAQDWDRINDLSADYIVDKIAYYEKAIVELENKYLSSSYIADDKITNDATTQLKQFFTYYEMEAKSLENLTA